MVGACKKEKRAKLQTTRSEEGVGGGVRECAPAATKPVVAVDSANDFASRVQPCATERSSEGVRE